MRAINKSKEQLTSEIKHLRQRIAELEALGSERKAVEDALRKSEEKYRTVVEISPDGIAIAANGRHVFANKSLARIFGVSSPEEVVGNPIMDHIHPDYRKIAKERMEQLIKRGKAAPLIEEKMIRADGTAIDTEVAAAPLKYEGKDAVLAVIRDITERKKVEEARRESEERYRNIFEKSPLGIGISSLDGKVVTCNKAMEAITGYTVEEFKKINLADIYEDKTAREALLVAIRLDGGVVNFPIRLKRQDGTVYNSLLTISRINLGGKELVQTICQDITERKQVEGALRESEMRYRSLFENSQDAILLTAPDGSIFDVNPAACQMFGRTAEEIKQIGRNGLVDPTDPRLLSALEERSRKGKARAEVTMIRKDGTKFPADVTSTIFTDEQGRQRTSMIIRDITESRRIAR